LCATAHYLFEARPRVLANDTVAFEAHPRQMIITNVLVTTFSLLRS
jgi:hypothetical protein